MGIKQRSTRRSTRRTGGEPKRFTRTSGPDSDDESDDEEEEYYGNPVIIGNNEVAERNLFGVPKMSEGDKNTLRKGARKNQSKLNKEAFLKGRLRGGKSRKRGTKKPKRKTSKKAKKATKTRKARKARKARK